MVHFDLFRFQPEMSIIQLVVRFYQHAGFTVLTSLAPATVMLPWPHWSAVIRDYNELVTMNWGQRTWPSGCRH